MKRFLIISACLAFACSRLFAIGAERVTQPSIPQGVNPAAFPAPRDVWYVTVQQKFDRFSGKHFDIVFDGDSITNRWENTGKEYWSRYFEGQAACFGIEGDRTENILWRLGKGQVNGIDPKVVVLMIGTNNCGRDSADQIAEGVKADVAEYKTRCPQAHIILMAVFPRGAQATDGGRVKVAEINAKIASLGDGDRVSFVDIGSKLIEPNGEILPSMMPDALHPTAKGYQIWSDAILPIIDKYVPRKAAAATPSNAPAAAPANAALPADASGNLALHKKYETPTPNVSGWGDKLTDGNWESIFATDPTPAFPKMVTIDLEKASNVGQVLVGSYNKGSTKTITVSLSVDGTTFTEVGSYVFTQGKAEKYAYRFPAQSARYVRLTYPDHYDAELGFPSTYAFTSEVEVYAPDK
jgi:lysophospholipase L1-like esterase